MIPFKYTKYIRLETGYGLLALTVALAGAAIIPRWDSAIQYCVPNTECRVVKEVEPETFNWHQEQAKQNAEKLAQRKKNNKKSGYWYSLAQDAYSGLDNATYDFGESWNNAAHTFSPKSTKEFLMITAEARRQGWQLKMVGELPGYAVMRKVAGALSLISVGGLMWVIAQLEEIQPKRDRVEELNFESAINRHQKALEGESTVITAEMDWEVAAGQKQLETKYLGDDSDEFLETLDAQTEEIGKDADRQEGMLNQITGTQTLDSINNPSDKVQGDNPSPAISSEKILELAQSLLQALNKLGYPSGFVRSTVGHTIIEIVVKPNDVTKVKQILGLGQALQVEMNLKAPPTISTVAGGVAISLPRPDRQVALFEQYVHNQKIDGIPKLAIGVDVYNNLHEYELSSKAVESMIIGGIPKAGKSQLIISMIASGIRRYSPNQIKFLLFDGKEGVELGFLDGNPYLVHSVASTSSEVKKSLEWYGLEIENRFKQFKSKGVTNLDDYNSLADIEKLPYIPAIADEIQSLFNLEKTSNEGGHLDILASIASLGRANAFKFC